MDVQLSVVVGDGDGYKYESVVALYEDLLFGRSLPLALVLPSMSEAQHLLAAVMFLDRKLLLRDDFASLVYHASLVERHGLWALAHVPDDHVRLLLSFQLLAMRSPQDYAAIIADASSRLQDLVGGVGVGLDRSPKVKVLAEGPSGFVVAESNSGALASWVHLFRCGFLHGVLFCGSTVAIANKSRFVGKDLAYAREILQGADGEAGHWQLSGLLLSCDQTHWSRQEIVRILQPAPMSS